MDFFSNLIMSKRKRELRNVIIVLRGVPGTGKTTATHLLYELFKNDYDYNVQIISRDNQRLNQCKANSIDYQASFRDPVFNLMVRDTYYENMYSLLNHLHSLGLPYVCIIDATNTKLYDIKHTLWTIRAACPKFKQTTDVYIYTKRTEHGSTHGVPECIMERFREELKESDEWLKVNTQKYNIKVVNKVALK